MKKVSSVTGDFCRIEVSGIAPDAIEVGLSAVEGQAAPVIRDVLRASAIPHGDDDNVGFVLMCASLSLPSGLKASAKK
jgi:hypothetical protein